MFQEKIYRLPYKRFIQYIVFEILLKSNELYLVETVVSVFQDVTGIVPELFTDGDEVHGDEEGREREETEGPLPTDGLNRIRKSSLVES